VDGTIIDIRNALAEGGENPLQLGRYVLHDIEAVVDRVSIKEGLRPWSSNSMATRPRNTDSATA
jgi:hypothetical protein